jgi:hypothetical protein
MKTVVILGTCHEENKNYKAEHIVDIMERLQPSIIFEELPEEWKVDLEFRKKNITGIESKAIIKYVKRHPECEVIQYDIQYRNRTLKEENYFEKQKQLNAALEKIYKEETLTSEDRLRFDQLYDIYKMRDKSLSNDHIRIINSNISDSLIRYKEKLAYRFYRIIVRKYKELHAFKEFVHFIDHFWKIRNEVMVENVVKALRDKNENIQSILLCGYEHREILKRLFNKHKNDIEVKEYWEIDVNSK